MSPTTANTTATTTATGTEAGAGIGAGAERGTGEGLRWPLGPLLDAAGLTATALACTVVGGNHWAIQAAARDGLDDVQADRWAIRLGLHPALVWGSAWFDAGHDPTRLTAGGPAYARIAARLRRRIETGDLPPGARSPSSDTLAAEHHVSPATAARALAGLTRDGLLVWAPHRGRLVAHPDDVGHPAKALEAGAVVA